MEPHRACAESGRECERMRRKGANAWALCVLPSLTPYYRPFMHARVRSSALMKAERETEGRSHARETYSSIVLVHRRAVEALESETTGNDDRQHESRQERELMYHATQQVLQDGAWQHNQDPRTPCTVTCARTQKHSCTVCTRYPPYALSCAQHIK